MCKDAENRFALQAAFQVAPPLRALTPNVAYNGLAWPCRPVMSRQVGSAEARRGVEFWVGLSRNCQHRYGSTPGRRVQSSGPHRGRGSALSLLIPGRPAMFVVRVAPCALGIWFLVWPVVAFAAPDPKTYWNVDELKPGMKGHGLTVMKGTKVEKFDAEVLGVMK